MKLADILQGDQADFIIPDGRKVLMNQVSGTLRNALMSKRQSIRLEGKPVQNIEELFNNLEVFINSYNIVHLNLEHVIIGNEGSQILSEYLSRCPSLVHLNLRWNRIEAEGAGSLAAVLPRCASLTHLDLSENVIGEEGAECLAAVLGQCPSLAHLELYDNDIGDEGLEMFAPFQQHCTVRF